MWEPGDSSASLATSAAELEGSSGDDMVSTLGASGYTYWGPVLLTHPVLESGIVLVLGLVLSWDASTNFTRFRFEPFGLFAVITMCALVD